MDGDTDGDGGALLQPSLPPVADVVFSSSPRIAVKRSEEGQRRFDELQRLLLHHSVVGAHRIMAMGDDDSGVGSQEPQWHTIVAPSLNRQQRVIRLGFDDL